MSTHHTERIDKLQVYGPTLAALLSSVFTGDRVCDGLLFGTTHHTARAHTHDGAEALVVEENTALVTSLRCCSNTQSFYDGTGVIDGERLGVLLSGCNDTLLGWFSYRPATPLQPSMREAAVTAHLQAWVAAHPARQQPPAQRQWRGGDGDGGAVAAGGRAAACWPLVFMVVTSGMEHDGATINLQYRAFQRVGQAPLGAPRPPGAGGRAPSAFLGARGGAGGGGGLVGTVAAGWLLPLDIETLNLGRSLAAPGGGGGTGHGATGGGCGGGFHALGVASALQHVALPRAELLTLHSAADQAAGAQVAAVAQLYSAMLAQLEAAVEKLQERSKVVEALRQEGGELLRRLAQDQTVDS